MSNINITICGGGNGSHVAAVLCSHHGANVRILSLFQDEAQRWNNILQGGTMTMESPKGNITASPGTNISNQPEQAANNVDILLLVVPAFAHRQYLESLKPFLPKGCVIIGMPGSCGFEFEVKSVLGDDIGDFTLVSYETLPWACRIKEFGKVVEVLGTKQSMLGAVHVGKNCKPRVDPVQALQSLLGAAPVLIPQGHLLGITLMSVNQIVHTSIMYDRWVNWDGIALDEAPLFYQGITDSAAELLCSMSCEIMATAKKLSDTLKIDMSAVKHIYDWYMACYEKEISDKSTLATSMRTNSAYKGLVHPMKKDDQGKFVPNFQYRYLTEDIPCGLLVSKGISEIVGLPTPNMDRVLMWAQHLMGKEYLVNGKMTGKDVGETRAPQRFGFTTSNSLI